MALFDNLKALLSIQDFLNVGELLEATAAGKKVIDEFPNVDWWNVASRRKFLLESLLPALKEGADVTKTEIDDEIIDRIEASVPHFIALEQIWHKPLDDDE